jgi:hypothetical protein
MQLLDRACFVREGARPIWDDLATVVDANITDPIEALALAGAAWEVYKTPLHSWITDPLTGILSEFTDTRKYAIHRADTNDYLGDVGEGFTLVQNHEAFKGFQPYLEEGVAYIESAGMFAKGRIVWLICRLTDSAEIILSDGDRLEQRVLLTLCHNTDRSAETIVLNTLASEQSILASLNPLSLRFIKIRQTKSVKDKLIKTQKEVEKAKEGLQSDAADYEKLMSIVLTPTNLDWLFSTLFERKLQALKVNGEQRWTVDELPEVVRIKARLALYGKVHPTAWDLYKAICAYCTFDTLERRRVKSKFQSKLELQVRSLWFVKDNDLHARALKLLLS